MREAVEQKLNEIGRENEVRVLFACESGSRAWGFPSEDSDYDVRFIYSHPIEWYLSIDEGRDVIEIEDGDLDLAGWDLRKALRLLRKSNPPLLEWLGSPIVYRDEAPFRQELCAAIESTYSALHCFMHYLSMARNNTQTYLRGESVRPKKYLYAIRPILACRWIERGLGAVPMLLNDLMAKTLDDREVTREIEELVQRKRSGLEATEEAPTPVLSAFIVSELARLEGVEGLPHQAPDVEELNRLFRRWIL